MKNLKMILLSLLCLFILASCNGNNDKKPTDSTVLVPTKPGVDDITTNTPTETEEKTESSSDNDEQTYIVEFETYSDTSIPSQRILRGDKVTKPNDPVKKGHIFLGWYINDEKWVFSGYPVTENLTLEAHYEKELYTIKFNSDNGKREYTKELYFGSRVELEEPTKKNYTFVNWVDSKGRVVDKNYLVDESTTITAKWKENAKYTIKVVNDNGDAPTSNIYYVGYKLKLTKPVKPGYTFVNWIDDKGNIVDENYVVERNATITAKWEMDTYEIKINSYNGKDIKIEEHIYGDKLYLPIPYKDWYDFIKWKDSRGRTVDENYKVYESTTIKAEYKQQDWVYEKFSAYEMDSLGHLRLYEYKGRRDDTYIRLASCIKEIGDNVFKSCYRITSISIPSCLEIIGDNAFSGCSNLYSIYLPNGLKEIGNNAFEGCTSLTSVSIPDTVTSLGYRVFHGCEKLSSVTLPKGIKKIGFNMFDSCNLENITIPEGVEIIEDSAFYHCDKMKSIEIPDSLLKIGSSAFIGCGSLGSITLPETLKEIGSSAFEGCSFKEITIPKGVTLNYGTFRNCGGLRSVVLPENMTEIPDSLFANCFNLRAITLQEGMQSIGKLAFYNCLYLKNIELPSSITDIKDFAFYNCQSFTNIDLPEKLSSIGESAFENCLNMTSIIIPLNVYNMGENAFSGCSKLTINCQAKCESYGWNRNWNPSRRPVNWSYTDSNTKINALVRKKYNSK